MKIVYSALDLPTIAVFWPSLTGLGHQMDWPMVDMYG